MAVEAREIIGFQEEQLRQSKDKLKDIKLGALNLIRVGVDYAEKIGALPHSLPQFSKTAILDQARSESQTTEAASLEKQIPQWDLRTEGKSPSELERMLKNAKVETGSYARSMIRSQEFTILPEPTPIRLGMLSVADMGFEGVATTAQILGTKEDVDEHGNAAPFTKGRITELGFELCPPEVGVYQRLHDKNQELNTAYWIAMKPIAGSDGHPRVFELGRDGLGLWLYDDWARPGRRWRPGRRLVVSVPQVTSKP